MGVKKNQRNVVRNVDGQKRTERQPGPTVEFVEPVAK